MEENSMEVLSCEPTKEKSRWKTYFSVGICLFVVQLAFSGYSVISVLYVKRLDIDIGFITMVRAITASILSPISVAIFEKEAVIVKKTEKWEIVYFAILGLANTALNPIMYLQVVKFTSASYVTILGQLIPIFCTIFSWIIKTQPLPNYKNTKSMILLISLFIGVGGAVAITALGFTTPQQGISTLGWLWGTLLGVLNNLVFSLYIVLQGKLFYMNPLSRFRSKPFTVNSHATIIGTLVFLPGVIIYLAVNGNSLNKLTVEACIPIFYAAIINTTFGSVGLTWCNKKSSGVIVSASYSLQVATSILMLHFFANETMTTPQYICCVVVVIAVVFVIFSNVLGDYIDKKNKSEYTSSFT